MSNVEAISNRKTIGFLPLLIYYDVTKGRKIYDNIAIRLTLVFTINTVFRALYYFTTINLF